MSNAKAVSVPNAAAAQKRERKESELGHAVRLMGRFLVGQRRHFVMALLMLIIEAASNTLCTAGAGLPDHLPDATDGISRSGARRHRTTQPTSGDRAIHTDQPGYRYCPNRVHQYRAADAAQQRDRLAGRGLLGERRAAARLQLACWAVRASAEAVAGLLQQAAHRRPTHARHRRRIGDRGVRDQVAFGHRRQLPADRLHPLYHDHRRLAGGGGGRADNPDYGAAIELFLTASQNGFEETARHRRRACLDRAGDADLDSRDPNLRQRRRRGQALRRPKPRGHGRGT